MFTLEDGRETLWQWDINRRIIVNDPKINEVHFCNHISDCALVVEVKDGLADIPNILLQDARPIRAYAYMDDSYTLTEQQFPVKARTKPCDYVYTETEVIQYSALDERIKAIETGITDTVATEVNKYIENNPITVDLSNYYNKTETNAAIDTAIAGIEFPETDLTGYATQQFVLDKVAEIEIPAEYITETELNAKGYATTGYVDNKVASIVIPDISTKADKVHTHKLSDITDYTAPDLSGYAKKTDIPDVSDFIKEIPAEYVTESELAGKQYATEVYVNDAVNNIVIPETDLSNYYTKTETDSIVAGIDTGVDITDDGAGNVTIREGAGGEITPGDLSNYYTKAEVDALIPTDYITAIPDYYVTETELEAKGYLTEHQSLAAYATKQYVTDSLTDVATKDYVNTAVNGANKAVSFSDYSAMVTALNTAAKTAYKIGQNIMIVTLGVPDLWVSNISETSSPYTYTTDTAITDALKANGVVQVGYFALSALETQKVDLTDYNTSTEVDGKIANAVAGVAETRVKENTTININVTSTVPVLNFVYSNPITAISSMNTNRVQGHSFQLRTAASCTVTATQHWIGDDCANGVFTPVANTNYEIYSYYNQVADKVINMVMNLGA